jgi:hypothetical protein
MRQYLYLFWALVLAGVLLLTAAYPRCPQYAANRCYQIYDTNGTLTIAGGEQLAAGVEYTLF